MDVFGGIVNICSIIDLTSKLIVVLSAYVSDVKGAEDSRKQFLDELQLYVEGLKNLKSFAGQTDIGDSSDRAKSLNILASFFQRNDSQTTNFHRELKALLAWLQQGAIEREGMTLVQKMRWPVEGKKRVKELMPTLSRHIQMFDLVLSIAAWWVLSIITIFSFSSYTSSANQI